MKSYDLKRIFRAGYINFKRSGFVSIASVLVMTITLSVVVSLIFLQAVLQTSLNEIREKVDVTVYMTTDAPEEEILELKNALESLPEVAMVAYVSEAEALERFRE